MTNTLLEANTEIYQDTAILSMVQAVVTARQAAKDAGIITEEKRLTVSQKWREDEAIWEISFGPKDYINKRGGDFIIQVRASDGEVIKTLRGQ